VTSPREALPSSPWTRSSTTLHPISRASNPVPPHFRLSSRQTSAKLSSCWHLTSSNPSTKNPPVGPHEPLRRDWYATQLYLTLTTCLVHFLLIMKLPTLLRTSRRKESSNGYTRHSLSTSFNTLRLQTHIGNRRPSRLRGLRISRVASQSLPIHSRKPPSCPSVLHHLADTSLEFPHCPNPLRSITSTLTLTKPLNMPSLSACMKYTTTAFTIY
jgi:hypothetical protein